MKKLSKRKGKPFGAIFYVSLATRSMRKVGRNKNQGEPKTRLEGSSVFSTESEERDLKNYILLVFFVFVSCFQR